MQHLLIIEFHFKKTHANSCGRLVSLGHSYLNLYVLRTKRIQIFYTVGGRAMKRRFRANRRNFDYLIKEVSISQHICLGIFKFLNYYHMAHQIFEILLTCNDRTS